MMNYYITEKEEIIDFVNTFAVNSDTFDFKKYVNNTDIVLPEQPKIITS